MAGKTFRGAVFMFSLENDSSHFNHSWILPTDKICDLLSALEAFQTEKKISFVIAFVKQKIAIVFVGGQFHSNRITNQRFWALI